MAKQNGYYWKLQFTGWGLAGLLYVIAFLVTRQPVNGRLFAKIGIIIFSGILATHLFREFLHRTNWLLLPVEKVFWKFLLGAIAVCLASGLFYTSITSWLNLAARNAQLDFSTRAAISAVENAFFIIPWTLIYYFYHYIEKSRKQQVDTLKLESMVKELELKTIKSHINPHFIFNALNSIRALVDENPPRARTAITELSNILRSSMKTEKQETVSLEKELNIVRDYLALEHIRFEDRLRVEYDISDDTLNQPVPPMMLQTLVENAIKHGISKQLDGGTVTIRSDFRQNVHELVIRNTGRLNGSASGDGFGLASTRNRLLLLFGERASFHIREVNGNTVEAILQIPVETVNKQL